MPKFGRNSLRELSTCHPQIQEVLNKAILYMDFSVLQGSRGERDQTIAFRSGLSEVPWPESKHNKLPSEGVDIAIYPLDWKDELAFAKLAGRILQIADEMQVTLRWGGDWDRDDKSNDQRFMDLGHFELLNV
jgi:peptidoglycan LD-endopeptidase CwlK